MLNRPRLVDRVEDGPGVLLAAGRATAGGFGATLLGTGLAALGVVVLVGVVSNLGLAGTLTGADATLVALLVCGTTRAGGMLEAGPALLITASAVMRGVEDPPAKLIALRPTAASRTAAAPSPSAGAKRAVMGGMMP